ncbi:alpha/beta-hydrolase, partial [Dentipellis sp. KUC8613]
KAFQKNSSLLPLVDFALQDPWAGRSPITNNFRQLFFWHWPSSLSAESDNLLIWLNGGGPGCSSLIGFLEENGPISFRPDAYKPVANQFAWTEASDVV